MSKPITKALRKIAEKTGSSKITIFTDRLKIDGYAYFEDGKCEECHEDILTLTNAMVCRLNDYCTCNEEDCSCNDYVCFKYDWLNVNVDKIVAYSIIES